MGNWNINIQGVGCHHNGKPEIDVDLAVKDFVQYLKKQGHHIESATFTYGGKIDLPKTEPGIVSCTINGETFELNNKVTYKDILLAKGFDEDRILSVTYSKALFGQSGILDKNKTIDIVNGTVFSIADTSNA